MAIKLTEEQTIISYLIQYPNLAQMYGDKFDKGMFLDQFHIDVYNEIKRCNSENIEVNRYTLERRFGVERIDYYVKLPITETTALKKIETLLKSQVDYYTSCMIDTRCCQFHSYHEQGKLINKDAFVNELVNLVDVSTDSTAYVVPDIVNYLMEQIQSPQKREKGLTTGYECLDKVTKGGFKKKHLIILLGASGMGKTTFVENLIIKMSRHSNGAFFSLEMPKEEVSEDIFGILSGVRFTNVVDNNEYLSSEGLDSFVIGMNELKDKITIYDDSLMSVQSIHRIVKLHKMQKRKLDYIIIDHLHIVQRPNKQNESEALADVARMLKVLAKEEDVSVIVLCQVNRDSKNRASKNPLLTDIKGSSAITENADFIFGLYRPSYDIKQKGDIPPPEIKDVVEVTQPKARRGESDKIYMKLNWQSGKLEGELNEYEIANYLSTLQQLNRGDTTNNSFRKN